MADDYKRFERLTYNDYKKLAKVCVFLVSGGLQQLANLSRPIYQATKNAKPMLPL